MHPRHERFVAEYLVDLNAAAAARRTGYAPEIAAARGCKLLYRKDIRAAVRAAMDARAARTRVTADRVVQEYARIAFSDLRRLSDWGPEGVALKPARELSADDTAAVKWVSIGGDPGRFAQRIKLHDKHRALAALARHLGLFDLRRAGDPERELQERHAAAARVREELARRIAALAPAEPAAGEGAEPPRLAASGPAG